MANPNKLAPQIDTTVLIVRGAATAGGAFAPLDVSEFVASPSFPTRIKSYTGSGREKDALLAADGFAADGATRRQVTAMMIQDGPPAVIWIGREDAGDADYGVTMDAIAAENDNDWYTVCIDERGSAAIQQVSAWIEPPGGDPRFAMLVASTDSTAVRDGDPGSFDQVLAALGRERTVLGYHDSSISSGLAAAEIFTRIGPFAFSASETLDFRFDGGITQSYTFVASAAIVTGSNTETFDLSAGGLLVIDANNLGDASADMSTTSATLLSVVSENYDLEPGDTLLTRVDGGAEQTTTVDAGAAITLGSGTEPFAPVNLETLDLEVNGGAGQIFTFDGTETTAQLTADLINATAIGFSASDVGGAVELRTDRQGTSATIEILVATAANILTEYGWIVGTDTGTGDVADIDAVTAAELAGLITTDVIGATAADVAGQVQITADSLGTASRLQVTGGNVNTVVGFPTNEASGTGPFADATAASAAEVSAVINEDIPGLVASVAAGAVVLISNVLGTSSEIDITAGAVATTLGLAAGVATGAGDFAVAAAATASELQIAINTAGIVGGSASEVGSTLVLASGTSGPTSSVEIITDTVGLSWSGDGFAIGVGTDEDYSDCAWVGRCITFALDSDVGGGLWDNQQLAGIEPDPLTDAQKTSLDQRRVNAYYSNGPRGRFLREGEMHWGYILRKNDANDYLYIDERTTADWLDLRVSEALKRLLDNYAFAKIRIPFTDAGFALIESTVRAVLKAAERYGHIVYDSTALDLTSDTDTGVFFPKLADLTQEDIDLRRYAGMRIRQQLAGGVQRINTLIEVQRPAVQL